MTEKIKITDTSPSLIGDEIYLRPATEKDIANTFHWFLQCELQSRSCRPVPFRTAVDAAEAYKRKEKSPDEQRFMVVRIKDKTPVGVINFFHLNNLNRSVEFGLLIDPDEQKKGYATEAVRILCSYMYNYRGLNKIYAQTSGFNKAAVKLLETTGFKRDAVLRQHYYFKGEFFDGYIYSLLRFEFDW